MKLKILALVVALFSSFSLFAQNPWSLKGTITDTAATYKMVNSTITILNAKDSTLVKYTRATSDGIFAINNLRKGQFILMATYPGYADYIENFSLDSINNKIDLGNINLTLKSTLLEGVIIKGKAAAIKIKGDTTEYNASSFVIQPNDKVEDLLKQLPGIQVDKDGKITAQGKTVTKVLVDGEEFFGDDPTLVTKNIRSDMVDRVQLYDKKSDQATFTGIDDGEKTKTINIKLKEDKKKGYFGKADAGIGTDKFYQGQVMFNKFRNKEKFSFYGTFGNTGKTGLDWQDNNRYGSSDGMEMGDDGAIYVSSGRYGDDLDSFDGRYNGQGIPVANSGGVHYDNKWNKDKESINTNYKAGSIAVESTQQTLTQTNLPNSVINSVSANSTDNQMFRQKLDVTYGIALDSTMNLKVSVDGALKNSSSNDRSSSTNERGDHSLLNQSIRETNNDNDQNRLGVSAFLTKKLKKKGRTLSLRVSGDYNQSKSAGFLNSKNEFYNTSGIIIPDSTQILDQYKTNNTVGSVFNSNLTYTEPLSKTLSLVLSYGLNTNNGSSDRASYNKSPSGAYENLDRQFSNNFKLDQLSNKGGAIFNFKKENTTISAGSEISAVNFKQIDIYTNNNYKQSFINWNPQASYEYRFSQQKSFRVNYYGSTSQPGIDQLQPIRINDDPLNIQLGNPDLKPSFNNSINLSYSSYKILSEQSLWINGSYSFVSNSMTQNVVTDETGKSTIQTINLDKNTANYRLSMNSSRKIKSLDMRVGLDLGADMSKNFNMVNNEINTTTSNNFNANLNIQKYKAKKYSFSLYMGPSYTGSKSSVQKDINNDGWGASGSIDLRYYLPGKIELNTTGNYQYKAKTQTFDQKFERFLWAANISKKFFKDENLNLTLSGNDLLNQNVGFDRNAYGNVVYQNSYTTIKRYFSLSLSWDFNKMGGDSPKK